MQCSRNILNVVQVSLSWFEFILTIYLFILIQEEYNDKLEACKSKGIEVDPNDLYLEVVGGKKKGKVYGLGSASHMYCKHLSSHSTASPSTPSITSQLSSQVEELKKMVEETQKVAVESHKVAAEAQKLASESLNLARETAENYKIEKAEWQKEMREMAAIILSVRRNSTATPTITPTPNTTLTGFHDP